MPDSAASRRHVLSATAAVGSVLLAGCGDAVDEVTGGPDPRVTDTQADQGLADIVTGSFDIRVLVVNSGDSGDVEVTVRILDGNGNTLDVHRQIVHIQEGESRRVDFSVSPPDGAEMYEAEAEAA